MSGDCSPATAVSGGLAQIHSILTRTTYIGEHRFNTRSHKARERKPQGEVVVMNVPPPIERKTSNAVQARLKQRHPMVTPPPDQHQPRPSDRHLFLRQMWRRHHWLLPFSEHDFTTEISPRLRFQREKKYKIRPLRKLRRKPFQVELLKRRNSRKLLKLWRAGQDESGDSHVIAIPL